MQEAMLPLATAGEVKVCCNVTRQLSLRHLLPGSNADETNDIVLDHYQTRLRCKRR